MAKISLEEANKLVGNDPIFKKGLTPYNLIINGIVTYDDWFNAMKEHVDPEDDKYYQDAHTFQSTSFGKKLLRYVRKLGWNYIYPNNRFKKRSKNTALESIKLINMKFSVGRVEP